jgi:hypothetical protein
MQTWAASADSGLVPYLYKPTGGGTFLVTGGTADDFTPALQ